jgi:hypothetical protein
MPLSLQNCELNELLLKNKVSLPQTSCNSNKNGVMQMYIFSHKDLYSFLSLLSSELVLILQDPELLVLEKLRYQGSFRLCNINVCVWVRRKWGNTDFFL